MLYRVLLGSGDQLRRPDTEGDGEHRGGRKGGASLCPLDTADVVAVNAAVEPEALLRDATLLA
jgi:hypothetical protein